MKIFLLLLAMTFGYLIGLAHEAILGPKVSIMLNSPTGVVTAGPSVNRQENADREI